MKKILEVKNLNVDFDLGHTTVSAVKDASFDLYDKEILCIVGESGSGKSVTCLSLLSLLPSYAKVAFSTLRYKGDDVKGYSAEEIRDMRGKQIAYIPQEPSRSYDPLFTIRASFAEVFRAHNKKITANEIEQRAVTMLSDVGIENARERLNSYFHQFSGGMIQRVMIALALCMNPSIVIADEPTTALDVIVQRKVLRLLNVLSVKYAVSLIFISHDIALVSEFAQRIMVMRRGRIVELGAAREVLQKPKHEYTRHLLKSIITLDTPPATLPKQTKGEDR